MALFDAELTRLYAERSKRLVAPMERAIRADAQSWALRGAVGDGFARWSFPFRTSNARGH